MSPTDRPNVTQPSAASGPNEPREADMGKTKAPLTLSVDEVAALTGRHPYVVRRWIRDGVLPATKLKNEQGQPYRIRAADLALVVRRKRWGAKTPPAAVPDRLSAVARISGAVRQDEVTTGGGKPASTTRPRPAR